MKPTAKQLKEEVFYLSLTILFIIAGVALIKDYGILGNLVVVIYYIAYAKGMENSESIFYFISIILLFIFAAYPFIDNLFSLSLICVVFLIAFFTGRLK